MGKPLLSIKKRLNDLRGHLVVMVLLRLLLVMALYSLCRVLFYLYNADLYRGMGAGRLFQIMAGGLRFDLTAILYLNVLWLVLEFLPLRVKFHPVYRIVTGGLFILINALGLAANIADMVYYRTTLRRTSLSVLDQFSHEKNLGALGLRFMLDYWPATLAFLSVLAILILLYRRMEPAGPRMSGNFLFYGSGVAGLVLMSGLFVAGVRGGFRHSTRPITVSNAAAYASVPEDVWLVVNTPFTLIRTATTEVIRKVEYFPDEASLEMVYTPVHCPVPAGEFRQLNVVVIILESFSMEFSGRLNRWVMDGRYEGYTPFLDSLMEGGVTWQHSFANGRKSIDAMPSVLCGIPSVEVPFILSHYSNNRINSLASLLKPKGYSSAFFHGAPNGSMGFDAFAKQAGFDHYYGMNEYGNDDDMDGMWGIWDLEFLQYAARTINTLPQPFAASVFTVSSHHPFQVPERFRGKFRTGSNKMYEPVQYTDYALREFFRTASAQPWFGNTLFVITADHVSSEVTMKEYKTAWGQYAIPIIFYGPGLKPAFDEDRVAQQTDILPTVLGLLNYDRPYLAFGKDLFSSLPDYAFQQNGTTYQMALGNHLLQFDGEKSLGLFDYREDRLLQRPLDLERGGMEQALKAFLQQYRNRMVDNRLVVP